MHIFLSVRPGSMTEQTMENNVFFSYPEWRSRFDFIEMDALKVESIVKASKDMKSKLGGQMLYALVNCTENIPNIDRDKK